MSLRKKDDWDEALEDARNKSVNNCAVPKDYDYKASCIVSVADMNTSFADILDMKSINFLTDIANDFLLEMHGAALRTTARFMSDNPWERVAIIERYIKRLIHT